MALRQVGAIELPAHVKPGGFDHAAVHAAKQLLYVAHTSNDALDVVDCAGGRFLRSIPGLPGIAGALVSEERNLIFTSNRGENTIGVFSSDDEAGLIRVEVGGRPNGLACDPGRNLLLAANAGNPSTPGPITVSLVDIGRKLMVADIPVPGRTRWTVFDSHAHAFYVNISDPPQIAVISSSDIPCLVGLWQVPAAGPHGLDLDVRSRRLFCACDAKKMIVLDADSGVQLDSVDLSGGPDVIFFNQALHHLYVAIGDPGVIEVFDTKSLERVETIATERGAHTMAFDSTRSLVYALLPGTHRAVAYVDEV